MNIYNVKLAPPENSHELQVVSRVGFMSVYLQLFLHLLFLSVSDNCDKALSEDHEWRGRNVMDV